MFYNLGSRCVTECLIKLERNPEHDVETVLEPLCEKTGLRDFRPGPTQTVLYNHRIWLEA